MEIESELIACMAELKEIHKDSQGKNGFSLREWVAFTVLIMGSTAAAVLWVSSQNSEVRMEMARTESRWVDRISNLSEKFDDKLAQSVIEINRGIPPAHITSQIRRHDAMLAKMDEKINKLHNQSIREK